MGKTGVCGERCRARGLALLDSCVVADRRWVAPENLEDLVWVVVDEATTLTIPRY